MFYRPFPYGQGDCCSWQLLCHSGPESKVMRKNNILLCLYLFIRVKWNHYIVCSAHAHLALVMEVEKKRKIGLSLVKKTGESWIWTARFYREGMNMGYNHSFLTQVLNMTGVIPICVLQTVSIWWTWRIHSTVICHLGLSETLDWAGAARKNPESSHAICVFTHLNHSISHQRALGWAHLQRRGLLSCSSWAVSHKSLRRAHIRCHDNVRIKKKNIFKHLSVRGQSQVLFLTWLGLSHMFRVWQDSQGSPNSTSKSMSRPGAVSTENDSRQPNKVR